MKRHIHTVTVRSPSDVNCVCVHIVRVMSDISALLLRLSYSDVCCVCVHKICDISALLLR